ncbi:prephenate dehydratase [Streptomyces prunicolor]
MTNLIIGYLGSEGSFHSMAVKPLLSAFPAESRGELTVKDLLAAVTEGETDYALLAVETNLCGLIGVHLRPVLSSGLTICGEVVYRARMALVAPPGLGLTEVRSVHSHPEALAECDIWLSENLSRADRVPTDSSSAGVRTAQSADAGQAAICDPDFARTSGLRVLADDIADPPGDITRFWLLGRSPIPLDHEDRTSLLIDPRHTNLSDIHNVFAACGVPISRIDCVTTRTELGDYRLFVEIPLGGRTEEVQQLSRKLAAVAENVRILGSYSSDLVATLSEPWKDKSSHQGMDES